MPRPSLTSRRRWLPAIFLGLVMAWIMTLRAPHFDVLLWNVDEGIHAAVAGRLLDGGVLYRDAVDQRTPVSYYAFAAAFAASGRDSLFAVRAMVALLIGLTAAGLYFLGRRAAPAGTGWWSAIILGSLSVALFEAGDAHAANTEWFAIFFTTAAALALWRAVETGSIPFALTSGGCGALAFLSKQPAILDLLPFGALLLYLGSIRALPWRTIGRIGFASAVGVIATTGACAAWLAAGGALDAAVFYTWTYNVEIYGPEISALERILSALVPFHLLWHAAPGLLLFAFGGAMAGMARLAQYRATPEIRRQNAWLLFILLWTATSLAGAASGGRGFHHYFIQCLPPLSLLAGWSLATAFGWSRTVWSSSSRRSLRWTAAGGFSAGGLVIAHLLATSWATRDDPPPPPDPALRAAAFVRAHTTEDERIFVWGFNPDIHLYAGRGAASRFVYSSFLTGLVPWTNLDPERDTAYAIVPGAMDQLIRDLEETRPAFVIDCSVGPHRRFEKYPIKAFPVLHEYVRTRYAEVDSQQFVPQGFRLHLIRDEARAAPVPLASAPRAPDRALPPPRIQADRTVALAPVDVRIEARDPDARLQRIELRIDELVAGALSFPPSSGFTCTFSVPFDQHGPGAHRLQSVAVGAGGISSASATLEVTAEDAVVPPEAQAVFAIPVAAEVVPPLDVRAPFGPSVSVEEGRRVYSLHAPAVLSYAAGGAVRLKGGFGIRPGAFQRDNASPTDGAEFTIAWQDGSQDRHVLFRRLLRPLEQPEDGAHQTFIVELPPEARGGRLELAIHPGPAGNAASDWTYWSDLVLETVP